MTVAAWSLIGGDLNAVAGCGVPGVQHVHGERQQVGDRVLLQWAGPGHRAGPAAGRAGWRARHDGRGQI
jgi:hypothetical protein